MTNRIMIIIIMIATSTPSHHDLVTIAYVMCVSEVGEMICSNKTFSH